MRTPAQVDELALAVEAHFLVGGQLADDFGLEFLAFLQEKRHGFIAIPDFTPNFLIAAHNVLHALFNGFQVIRCERGVPVEVIIEAVGNGRANGHLGIREQLLYGFGHDMGGIVANQLQGLVGLPCDDFHRGAVVDGQIDVDQVAVGFGGQGLFGEFFADTSGDLEGGGRLLKLHACPIGQLIAHTHETRDPGDWLRTGRW